MPSVGGTVPAVISGFSFTSKTGAYVAAAGEYVLANATTAGFTVTLPASPSTGTVVGVKKVDTSANLVTVVGSNATTIDGDTTCTLNAFDAAGTFAFDGTNWQIQSTVALNGTSSGFSYSSTLNVLTKTASYTANAGEYVLAQNAITVTLPSSPASGALVGVRKTDFPNTAVTISASQSIDGLGTTYVLTQMNQAVELVYDAAGTAWRTVRNTVPARVEPAPVMATSAWYTNCTSSSGAGSTTTVAASTTYYVPYYLARSMTFGAISFATSSATTSGVVRLGLYSMNPVTAQPAAVLYDFGTISTSTSGTRQITNGTSLIPAGWMYFALAANTAGLAGLYITPFGPSVLPMNSGGLGANPTAFYSGANDGTPTFVANPTSLTAQVGTTIPVIYFQTGPT